MISKWYQISDKSNKRYIINLDYVVRFENTTITAGYGGIGGTKPLIYMTDGKAIEISLEQFREIESILGMKGEKVGKDKI